MENPFRSYYYHPSSRPRYYSQTPRSVPVFSPDSQSVPARQPSNSKPSPAPQPSTVTPSKPKLVSIPVHFVVSEKIRAVAAIKIQKVFRGFLVRKAVKKIAKIKSEVVEMEKRVSGEDTAEMLRMDEKERLRLNEILMSLLFRLDSIRGFDSGVRDCRKMVIKRVIALQEQIDAIAAARDSKDLERMDDFDVMKSEGGEALNQTLEFAESAVNQIPEIAVSALNQTSIDHSSESDDASLNRDLESTEFAADITPIIPDPSIVQTHQAQPSKIQEQVAEMQAIDEIADSRRANEEAPQTQISVDLAENNRSSINENTDSAVNLAPIIPDPVIVQTHQAQPSKIQEQRAERQAIDEIASSRTATEEAPETQISVDCTENNQSSIDGDTNSAVNLAPIIPDPVIVLSHQAQPSKIQEQRAERQAIDEIASSRAATEEAPETQISVDLAENNQSSIDEDTDSAVNLAPIIPDPAATMEIQGIDEKGGEGPVSPDKSWEKYGGMMQRMVEENEKLQQLVAELCQSNVLQNRMVGALSQRVEQLERAMARSRSEKKKSGSANKMRKCGKRL